MLALFALIVAAPIAAQDDDEDKKRKPGAAPEDPYTKGDEAAIEAAGYTSLGPFAFGDNHTTLDIDHVLGVDLLTGVHVLHDPVGLTLVAVLVGAGRARVARGAAAGRLAAAQ